MLKFTQYRIDVCAEKTSTFMYNITQEIVVKYQLNRTNLTAYITYHISKLSNCQ